MAQASTLFAFVWVMSTILFQPYPIHANESIPGEDTTTGTIGVFVKLGIVCDFEFSKMFNFDQPTIKNYWVNHVRSMQVVFQTLNLTRVSFSISSIMVTQNTTKQPFIEKAKLADGSAELSTISTHFQEWLRQSEITHTSNVVLLATGASGQHVSSSNYKGACDVDISANTSKSFVILRSNNIQGIHHIILAIPFARLLGAKLATETSCSEATYVMKNFFENPTSYYFSNCSDEEIYAFVQTDNAKCLKTPGDSNETNLLANENRKPLSLLEQCKAIFHNESQISINTTTMECYQASCYSNEKELGFVTTAFGTPCMNSEKFCFRGDCLPTGSILKNSVTKNCLLSSIPSLLNAKISLQSCPDYSFRYNEIEFRGNETTGYIIVATHNNLWIKEKCLANSEDQETIVFLQCQLKSTNKFLWDLIPTSYSAHEFRLCHRGTQKCAISDGNQNFVLSENQKHRLGKWMLEGKTRIDGAYNVMENKAMFSSPKTTRVVVKLAMFCDNKCFRVFHKENNVLHYWQVLTQDVNVKYRAIESLDISFVITSTTFLWDKSNITYSLASLQELNDKFSEEIYKQASTLPEFHIAVLTTGVRDEHPPFVFEHASACQNDTQNGKFLSVLTTAANVFDLKEDCMDLASVLGKMLSNKPTTNEGSNENCNKKNANELQNCGNSRYHFAPCRELLIRQFIMSERGNCFRSDKLVQKETVSIEKKNPSYTFAQQCSNLQDNFTSNHDEKNCTQASCYNLVLSSIQKTIYPLYGTPCGDKKFCFWGECVTSGLPLIHSQSKKCMVSTKVYEYDDQGVLLTCRNPSTPFDTFNFTSISGGLFLISTVYIEQNKIAGKAKCLTINAGTGQLWFKLCPDSESANFGWKILTVAGESGQFLLKHNATGKCAQYKKTESLLTANECELFNDSMWWQRSPVLQSGNVSMEDAMGSANVTTSGKNGATMWSADVYMASVLLWITLYSNV